MGGSRSSSAASSRPIEAQHRRRRAAALVAALALAAATSVSAFDVAAALAWYRTVRLPTAADEAELGLMVEALGWLGTPYVFGGSGVAGVDCSGFVYRVLGAAREKAGPPRSSQAYSGFGSPAEGGIRPGDILLFGKRGRVNHVGIAVSEGAFIHAASAGPRRGVIISSLAEDYWRQSYAGARRIGECP